MENRIKKVLETLEANGYEAWLVGGYVRDYLLGKETTDIDIATNATPSQIKAAFHIEKTFPQENHYCSRRCDKTWNLFHTFSSS